MKGRWKQVDVTRVLRAAHAAGLRVAGFNIDPQTGKIEVVTQIQQAQDSSIPLNQWMAKHARETERD